MPSTPDTSGDPSGPVSAVLVQRGCAWPSSNELENVVTSGLPGEAIAGTQPATRAETTTAAVTAIVRIPDPSPRVTGTLPTVTDKSRGAKPTRRPVVEI
ncbi:hypothetical protein GCM10022243_50990 [Saccharothrix violaceirubra]